MKLPFTLWINISNFKKVKHIYISFGLVFESLTHEVDLHVYSIFLYLLICILDLFVYVTQLHECTNFCLLRSNLVNYFLVHCVLYLLNWCSNVITVYIKIIYVMSKPQILY